MFICSWLYLQYKLACLSVGANDWQTTDPYASPAESVTGLEQMCRNSSRNLLVVRYGMETVGGALDYPLYTIFLDVSERFFLICQLVRAF